MASIFSGKSGRLAGMYGADTIHTDNVRTDQRIGSAMDAARGLYGQASNRFSDLMAPGSAYGLYTDALGLNGVQGNQRAVDAFQIGPGYQFAVDQANQGLQRSAAANGMLKSGNTLAALAGLNQNLANQEYGNWLGRLGQAGNYAQSVAGAQGGLDTGLAGLGLQTEFNRGGLNANAAGQIAGYGSGALMAGQNAAANRFGALMGGLNLAGSLFGNAFGFGSGGGVGGMSGGAGNLNALSALAA